MSSVDKNKAIIEFLATCPQIQETPLYFNFINAQNDTKQIITVSNDVYVNRPYIDGSVLKRYTFTLIDFKSISDLAIVLQFTGYDNENLDDMSDVQAVIDWISEQNELKNFPNFGEDCIVQEMHTTTENPNLDGINQDAGLAMYSITIQIDYIDVSKKVWR